MFSWGAPIRDPAGLNARGMSEIIKILVCSEFAVRFRLGGSDVRGYMKKKKRGQDFKIILMISLNTPKIKTVMQKAKVRKTVAKRCYELNRGKKYRSCNRSENTAERNHNWKIQSNRVTLEPERIQRRPRESEQHTQ